MINKIFNWVGGSFFRTIGRFLFYALLLFILSLFLKNIDVKASTKDFFFVQNQGYINTSHVYNQTTGIVSNIGVVSTGSSVNVHFSSSFQLDENLSGTSYFLKVDVCTGSNFYDASTDSNNFSGSFYFVDHIYHNQGSVGSCTINNQSAILYQDIYVITLKDLLFNTEEGGYVASGSFGFWAGGYTTYETGWKIENVQYLDYDLNFLNQLEINNSNQIIINSQQETNDKLDQTNEELGEMNDFIQDDTEASTSDIDMDSLGTVSGLLPAGPVDSLLNIPFTFLSVLTSSMSGTCVPITGTFVFDSTLSIPCFDSFYDEVPDYLMNFINLIPAGFILILYFKHLYKKVDRAVSLQSTADDEWGVI